MTHILTIPTIGSTGSLVPRMPPCAKVSARVWTRAEVPAAIPQIQALIEGETDGPCGQHFGTRERHGTKDLLPAKRLGELLVLEHPVLDRQDAAHVEMFDAGKGSCHVIGLDRDHEDIGVVHLLMGQ